MSGALVVLAERGVRAEAEAKQQLKVAYRNFVEEVEPECKNEAWRDLIRAIFGKLVSILKPHRAFSPIRS